MKILLALSLLLFTFSNPISQNTDNSIEDTNIHIINAAKKSYSLGSAIELQKAFGKATVKKEKDEVLGGYGYTYKYKGLETYFNEINWEATSITTADYQILLNGVNYKVGDPLSKLKTAFPLSYKFRENDRKMLRIGISHKKVFTDAAVVISYDSKGYITEIWIGNNNS